MTEVTSTTHQAVVRVPVWLLWREYLRRERLSPEQREAEDAFARARDDALINGDSEYQAYRKRTDPPPWGEGRDE